jgi:hypothetical protein
VLCASGCRALYQSCSVVLTRCWQDMYLVLPTTVQEGRAGGDAQHADGAAAEVVTAQETPGQYRPGQVSLWGTAKGSCSVVRAPSQKSLRRGAHNVQPRQMFLDDTLCLQAASKAEAEILPTFTDVEELILSSSAPGADLQTLSDYRQEALKRMGDIARLEQVPGHYCLCRFVGCKPCPTYYLEHWQAMKMPLTGFRTSVPLYFLYTLCRSRSEHKFLIRLRV